MRGKLFSRIIFAAIAIMMVSFWGEGSREVVATDPKLQKLQSQFYTYSGTQLVFDHRDLPDGRYFDVLVPLTEKRRIEAAEICLREVKKLPPGYLGETGMEAVGVFAACVSKTGDGFRPYDKQLKGYRYLGVYNGSNAVAAAFYGESQLPLTFHHEIFHHIDSTVEGKTERWQLSADDAVYQAAISGRQTYPTAAIDDHDVKLLGRLAGGETLRDQVSVYAAKNLREDQAETARHLMSLLPDSILQTVQHPTLPGSQRIRHVLKEYELAVHDGPDIDWFVDVALRRLAATELEVARRADELTIKLERYASPNWKVGVKSIDEIDDARELVREVARLDPTMVPPSKSEKLLELASVVTRRMMKQRIQPESVAMPFVVWGSEEPDGVNWTLRRDIETFTKDAKRLNRIASLHGVEPNSSKAKVVAASHAHNSRLLDQYLDFIQTHWSVTPGTADVFQTARDSIAQSLVAEMSL